MANLAITEAQVLPDTAAGAQIRNGIAGAAIAAGESVYLDAATNTWKLAASVVATLGGGKKNVGIAMNAAEVATQKIAVQVVGSPTLGAGASIAAGTVYVVSATAGSIAPEVDIASPSYICIIGVGNASNGIDMGPGGVMLATAAHAV